MCEKNYDCPLVSVIIPCYNAERYVKEAVYSIINQTYKNLEILVCDDCSEDSSLFILEELKEIDSRIRIIHHKKNNKLIKTLNELVSESNGKYIARMDADDISLPLRIEKQVEYLEKNHEISGCGCLSIYIDEMNQEIGKSKMPITPEEVEFVTKYYSPLTHPTVMFRKSVLEENPYDLDFVHAEDYELWCRLVYNKKIKICNLDQVLFKYRFSNNQISNLYRKEQAELWEKIYIKHELGEIEFAGIHADIFRTKKYDCYPKSITVGYIDLCAKSFCENKKYISSIFLYKALLKYCFFTKHFGLLMKLMVSGMGIKVLFTK